MATRSLGATGRGLEIVRSVSCADCTIDRQENTARRRERVFNGRDTRRRGGIERQMRELGIKSKSCLNWWAFITRTSFWGYAVCGMAADMQGYFCYWDIKLPGQLSIIDYR